MLLRCWKVETMSHQGFGIRKSTPHIGAEILGVDLSKPPDNEQIREVLFGLKRGVT
jgi:hypothetical protein